MCRIKASWRGPVSLCPVRIRLFFTFIKCCLLIFKIKSAHPIGDGRQWSVEPPRLGFSSKIRNPPVLRRGVEASLTCGEYGNVLERVRYSLLW